MEPMGVHPRPTSACPCGEKPEGSLTAARRTAGRQSLRSLATLSGALLSMLPSFTCPACIAAYAGVLSALGLGFVLREELLAPLIVLCLVAGTASTAASGRAHGRAGPLALTIVGSLLVAAGRLVWSMPALMYGGAALLVGTSLWNLWLERTPRVEEEHAA